VYHIIEQNINEQLRVKKINKLQIFVKKKKEEHMNTNEDQSATLISG
jgi:hypothetical protein